MTACPRVEPIFSFLSFQIAGTVPSPLHTTPPHKPFLLVHPTHPCFSCLFFTSCAVLVAIFIPVQWQQQYLMAWFQGFSSVRLARVYTRIERCVVVPVRFCLNWEASGKRGKQRNVWCACIYVSLQSCPKKS